MGGGERGCLNFTLQLQEFIKERIYFERCMADILKSAQKKLPGKLKKVYRNTALCTKALI